VGQTSRAVQFEGAHGQELDGRIELPADEAPRAWALFAHCFTCGKQMTGAVRLARALAEEGFGVLRFDFTGLGESEGAFGARGISGDVADLRAAADFLAREYAPPALLIGHSLGGAAVVLAAPTIASVTAVATIGAPAEPEHVTGHFREQLDEIRERGEGEVRLGGRSFTISRSFVEDLEQAAMGDALQNLDAALLIMHAPADPIVDLANAERIYHGARHPKSFVALDGADHFLSDPADARYAAELLAAWVVRFLPTHSERTAEAAETGAQGVSVHNSGGLRCELRADGHRLIADEPRQQGGDDEGPTPYGYLLAALGSCTAMTLRMYARHKDWPLEDVDVQLRHRQVHSRDCDDCDEDERGLQEISLALRLTGELDKRQRKRLREIAERCPVHRTLKGPLRMQVEEES